MKIILGRAKRSNIPHYKTGQGETTEEKKIDR